MPQLLSTVAEPELCRRSSDDDKITGYRDVRDVGDLIMTLVTKSNDSERKPDPECYTLPLVDFLEQTLTRPASRLKQVCPCLFPPPPETRHLIQLSTTFWQTAGDRVIWCHWWRQDRNSFI